MKIILFSKPGNKLEEQIMAFLQELAKNDTVEIFNAIDCLSDRLKGDTSNISIILLLAPEKKILTDLLLIRHQLMGHRIVIILPDQTNDTLSMAHSLYPRFIAYRDGDLSDLRAVIEKMLLYLDIHSRIKTLQDMDVVLNIAPTWGG